jgi:small basic protein (TIGR04137 family)
MWYPFRPFSRARNGGLGTGNMSLHRSLKSGAGLGSKRSVLKRLERVELLKKRGKWKEGDRVTGLPKTKPSV